MPKDVCTVIKIQPIVVKPDEKLILSIVKPPPSPEDMKWLVSSLEELFEGERKFLVINGQDAIEYYVIMKEATKEIEMKGKKIDSETVVDSLKEEDDE